MGWIGRRGATWGWRRLGQRGRRWPTIRRCCWERTLSPDGLEGLLACVEIALDDLEAQNVGGDDPPPGRLPRELTQLEALRERVQAALERVAATDGPARANVTDPDATLRAHRAVMATEPARTADRRRKTLPEPAFGILKEQQAARRFLLRGLVNVQAEWSLLATAFNLRTLARRSDLPAAA